MTIESMKRVMWRLRVQCPDNETPTNQELQRAVMYELGTDWRTYTKARRALLLVKFIKSYGKQRIRLTNVDLTDT